MAQCLRLRRQRGFTYLGLIILVAIIALVAAAGLKMGSVLQRSAAEQELLDIGAQFSDALKSYESATPAGRPTQPPALQDLLKDPRFPTVRRHLRKIFVDPVTGKAEWGVVYLSGQKGVIGVYSLSQAKPFKQGNFELRFQGFDGKEHLSDWKFTATGETSVATSTTTKPAAAGTLPAATSTPPATVPATSSGSLPDSVSLPAAPAQAPPDKPAEVTPDDPPEETPEQAPASE
jgi:type II secretory pathway pseudopilin PulG